MVELLLLLLYEPFYALAQLAKHLIGTFSPSLIIGSESKLALSFLIGVLAALARWSTIVNTFDFGTSTENASLLRFHLDLWQR